VRRRKLVTIVALVAAACLLALAAPGCGSTSTPDATASSTTPPLSGSITVSAAASLTTVFSTIRDEFLAAHPDAHITLNFGSSSQLGSQIESGAPVDVAAFADEVTMKKLDDAGQLADPSMGFATNVLVIATKPGNPKNIHSVADLASAGTVSLCATGAPCGRYAGQVLAAAGVTIPESSISRGQDVKTTLGAVTEGDADAGIVYVTDARSAGAKVATVEIPASINAVARYPIGVLRSGASPELARAFMSWVLGSAGQAALRDAGFGAP
jgi:molybdate transport system substrate-binding protein